jgi:hypothetical protein
MIIFDGMNSELNILNKYFKKMFPFVIKVDNIALLDYNNILQVDIYVSPTHYAEVSYVEVRKLINEYMLEKSAPLIKTVIPEWSGRQLSFKLNASLTKESVTILYGLDLSL